MKRRNPLFGRSQPPRPIPAAVKGAVRTYYRAVHKEASAGDRAKAAHEQANKAFVRLEDVARRHGMSAKEANQRMHRRYL